MKSDNKNGLTKNSQKFVTWIGYFWIIFSVISGFLGLFSFCFSWLKVDKDHAWLGAIIFASIILISALLALLLLSLFPSILDILFNRRPESEKYFKISETDEIAFLRKNTYSFFPYLERQEDILKPLIDLSKALLDDNYHFDKSSEDFSQIFKTIILNSRLLHRMCNDYLRVLNGIYALFILDKLTKKYLVDEQSEDILYLNCLLRINDLGWSLYRVSKDINDEDDIPNDDVYNYLSSPSNKYLLNFAKEHDLINFLPRTSSAKEISNGYYSSANNNIVIAKNTLQGNKNLQRLYVQSLRQLISISKDNCMEDELMLTYYNEIMKIKNVSDREDALGNYHYLRASKFLARYKKEKNPDFIQKGLDELKEADVYYKNDQIRLSKTKHLRGRLLFSKATIDEANPKIDLIERAISIFEEANKEAKSLSIHDQVLKNYHWLCKSFKVLKKKAKVREQAKAGLEVATILKARTFIKIFNSYLDEVK